MSYQIEITPSARRQFKRLPADVQKKIRNKLDALAFDPFAASMDVKKLAGREGYRLRVGDYRVIYTLENNLLVIVVLAVGNRREIYN